MIKIFYKLLLFLSSNEIKTLNTEVIGIKNFVIYENIVKANYPDGIINKTEHRLVLGKYFNIYFF